MEKANFVMRSTVRTCSNWRIVSEMQQIVAKALKDATLTAVARASKHMASKALTAPQRATKWLK